jgi:hypothetical protein
VSIDLKAVNDSRAELVGYRYKATTLRAKYTSKVTKLEQQAKEARRREQELLHFFFLEGRQELCQNFIRRDKRETKRLQESLLSDQCHHDYYYYGLWHPGCTPKTRLQKRKHRKTKGNHLDFASSRRRSLFFSLGRRSCCKLILLYVIFT